jgi:hypothetical protein
MKKLACLALALSWSPRADAAQTRVTVDLATVPSSHAVVTTNVGLAGGVAGRPFPRAWHGKAGQSFCARDRRSSFEGSGGDSVDAGTVVEIVTVAGVEYVDTSEVSASDAGALVVTDHTHQRVVRVDGSAAGGTSRAPNADDSNVVVWAWRAEGSRLALGMFGDVGDLFRASFGCRFITISLPLGGGTARLESSPQLSNPAHYGLVDLPNAAHDTDPSFTMMTSVSRSASDAAPVFVVRLTVTGS